MNKPREELTTTITHALTDLINIELRSLSSEERFPGGDADASDDKIRELQKRVKKLRQLRTEFEETVSGVCALPPAESP